MFIEICDKDFISFKKVFNCRVSNKMISQKSSLLLFFLLVIFNSFSQVDFEIPTSVCVGEDIIIKNVSSANTYYWTFCSSISDLSMEGSELNNQGNLSNPVFMKLVKDQNGYFGFVVNHSGSITRNFYGASFLNTPTSTYLGNLGVISGQAEGIEIINENGNWYGYLTAGGDISPRLIKITFGNSLLNTPSGYNLGNIGNLNFPHDLQIIKEDGKYYGFTANFLSNSITRFDFGNSINNIPTGTNLGNIGSLEYPVGISLVKENSKWFMFVTNQRNKPSVSRLSFGSSLISVPSGANLGDFGVLEAPRDITIHKECGKVYGVVVNQNQNDLVKLDFDSDLSSTIMAKSLGNLGGFSFPHGISEMFREGSDVYTYITNVNSSTLSLIKFKGCDNSSIPSSTVKIPPSFSYNKPGVYTIKLTTDEFLQTQSVVCKNIEVVDCVCPSINLGEDTTLCNGQKLEIDLSVKNYELAWQDGSKDTKYLIDKPGIYWVDASKNNCTVRDSLKVSFKDCSCPILDLGRDTVLCTGSEYKINLNNPDFDFVWQDGSGSNVYTITSPGIYWLAGFKNNCKVVDSIKVEFRNCCIPSTIPNVITPNGDGKNDSFKIDCATAGWELLVVSRWGNIIYENSDYNNEWDGRGCATGTYYYILKNKELNVKYKGYIQLMR
jgi:gliding motility-associated-like protein